MECHCYLRNIQDLLSDGKSPYERRFGMPLNGTVIPFGAMVEYHSISAKEISRLHQFVPNVLPGIFLGYVLYAGGIWRADIEELEEMDASEIHARRLRAKEALTPMKGDNFIMPSRRWNSQNFWRRSTSGNIHLNPGQPRQRRRTILSSRRIRRALFQPHSKMTLQGMMRKLKK